MVTIDLNDVNNTWIQIIAKENNRKKIGKRYPKVNFTAIYHSHTEAFPPFPIYRARHMGATLFKGGFDRVINIFHTCLQIKYRAPAEHTEHIIYSEPFGDRNSVFESEWSK